MAPTRSGRPEASSNPANAYQTLSAFFSLNCKFFRGLGAHETLVQFGFQGRGVLAPNHCVDIEAKV